MSTLKLIDSGQIKIAAGDWLLQWGNINPQELPLQKIVIIADCTDGNVLLKLPPADDEQSKHVQLFVVALHANKPTPFCQIKAANGDFIGALAGAEVFIQTNRGARLFTSVSPNNWFVAGSN